MLTHSRGPVPSGTQYGTWKPPEHQSLLGESVGLISQSVTWAASGQASDQYLPGRCLPGLAAHSQSTYYILVWLYAGTLVTAQSGNGCGRTCNCPNKPSCTSGNAKATCCWNTVVDKCFDKTANEPNALQLVGGGGGPAFPAQLCPTGTTVSRFLFRSQVQGEGNSGVASLGPGVCAVCSDGTQVCNPRDAGFTGVPVPGSYDVFTVPVASDGTLTLAQGQCFGLGVETVCMPGVPTDAQSVVLKCQQSCQSIVGFSGNSGTVLDKLNIICG